MKLRLRSLISVLLLTVPVLPTLASDNFIIQNRWTQQQKDQWEQVAEEWRAKWMQEFVGHDIPYTSKVRLTINFDREPSGVTMYQFDRNGNIASMSMVVNGPVSNVQYSVLPHEVMHSVSAYYFRTSPPRWSDEGYCTFIEPQRHVPPWSRRFRFKEIMNMQNYPQDVGSFYAQSTSMVGWLVNLKDKQHFRDFIGDYLNQEGDWPVFLDKYYGFKSYEEAEQAWLSSLNLGESPNSTRVRIEEEK